MCFRRTWAILVSTLASLLSLSLLLHAVAARRRSAPAPFLGRQGYSYVPLNNLGGTEPLAAGGERKRGDGGVPLDESDSQG